MLFCDFCKHEIKKPDTYTVYSFPSRIKDNRVISWTGACEICQECAITIAKNSKIKMIDESSTLTDNLMTSTKEEPNEKNNT